MLSRRTPGMLDRAGVRITALVLLAVAAAYQCFWRIGSANIGGDEATYVKAGLAYVHGQFDQNREHPPTAKYLFGLAQLIGGPGALAPRVLVASLVVLGAAVMFVWLRAEVGFWSGFAAATLWTLTPRGGAGERLDRVALLDPVMVFFAITALFAIWMWIRTDRWWWVPLSAVLMAASVTSKVSTLVLLPVFVLAPVLFGRWRALLVAAVVWGATFVVAVVALYAPMGMRSAVLYMLTFQEGQNETGHLVSLAGRTYQFAPWWANWWFLLHGVGTPVVVVLAVGVLLAFVVRPDRFVVFLVAPLLLLVVFYSVVAEIALPTYYAAWMPFIVMLAAVGIGRLVQLRPWWLTSAVAVVLVGVAVLGSLSTASTIWESRSTGVARLLPLLRHEGVRQGKVFFGAITPSDYDQYVGDRGVRDVVDAPFVAIVVGHDRRFPLPAEVQELLAHERASFDRVRLDGVVAWIPDGEIVRTQDGGLTVRR
ncbi:ArnT family glycosyltransferase [Curtobacterium sp. CFBP9011]|uniref:ArnT family glycosyltransferase n=1 Tax=Curtobacterium sp. CFBP9011 TaxID=3096530 RepID=UPI002A6B344D|nr:glycosyltransferase family 39 protein [Curtobacterium sp. CFBP9011]MDY1006178.1 glycosyltransferase family 39 protein [Curtobacterium sp. CFBP9011]